MICDNCKCDYPFEYLSPFISSRKNIPNCCGICALQLSNELHNVNRQQFDGEIAEDMRQRALKWRQRHPSKGPQVEVK